MTILEALAKAAGAPVELLVKLFEAGAAALPDLTPEAQEAIARLRAVATPEALTALASAVMVEAKNIAGGKIDPRNHPGDAV